MVAKKKAAKKEMNMEIKIDSCPQGQVNAKCKTEDCIYQEGKWRGDNVPDLAVSQKEKNIFVITCNDETE